MRWKMAKEALDVVNDEEWSFWGGKIFKLRNIGKKLFDVYEVGVVWGKSWTFCNGC